MHPFGTCHCVAALLCTQLASTAVGHVHVCVLLPCSSFRLVSPVCSIFLCMKASSSWGAGFVLVPLSKPQCLCSSSSVVVKEKDVCLKSC